MSWKYTESPSARGNSRNSTGAPVAVETVSTCIGACPSMAFTCASWAGEPSNLGNTESMLLPSSSSRPRPQKCSALRFTYWNRHSASMA